jgi:hypothetical protein
MGTEKLEARKILEMTQNLQRPVHDSGDLPGCFVGQRF